MCEKCGEPERKASDEAWKYVCCVICGGNPMSRKELDKWIEDVCVRCQEKLLKVKASESGNHST